MVMMPAPRMAVAMAAAKMDGQRRSRHGRDGQQTERENGSDDVLQGSIPLLELNGLLPAPAAAEAAVVMAVPAPACAVAMAVMGIGRGDGDAHETDGECRGNEKCFHKVSLKKKVDRPERVTINANVYPKFPTPHRGIFEFSA